jgi:TolB protein
MNADGTGVVQLTQSSAGLGIAQWSPDDSKILFSQPIGESRDIYVMGSDGTAVRRLTHGFN